MVERKVLLFVLVLLVSTAVAVAISAYDYGRQEALSERITSTLTTTSTTTATTTTTEITTSTYTTTTLVKQQPLADHTANSSSVIIRSRIVGGGRVLIVVSIDKPAYKQGEAVHIKGTATNLTPNALKLSMEFPNVHILNTSDIGRTGSDITPKTVWMKPCCPVGGLGPGWFEYVSLNPGETAIIDEFTANWSLVGRYQATIDYKDYRWTGIIDNETIPSGSYIVEWYADIGINSNAPQEEFDETATLSYSK